MADPFQMSDDDEYVSVPKDEPLMPDLVGQTPDSLFGFGTGTGSGSSNTQSQSQMVSGHGDSSGSAEQTPTDSKMPVDLLSNKISEIPEIGLSDDANQQQSVNLDHAEEQQQTEQSQTPASGLLLDFGLATQSDNSNTQPSIQEQELEDFKEQMDDQTPIQEPEPVDFMRNEATPPPSPPPSPVQTTEPVVEEQPPFDLTPPTERKPMPADTTTPSSEDRPVRMPKATTISPPSKAAGSRTPPSLPLGGEFIYTHTPTCKDRLQ